MATTKLVAISTVLIVVISFLSSKELELDTTTTVKTSYPEGVETVTDVDGNVYAIVSIGAQVWMVENLATTRYRDGSRIPQVEDEERWTNIVTGAYCRPALKPSKVAKAYGLLYNFRAVSDCRGLCPDGCHVPTAEEWRELIEYLGGDDVAGSKMKVTSAGSWRIQVPGTNNESGFSALPAGGRGRLGSAGEVGKYATWWSSTSHDSFYAWHWGLHPDKNGIRANPGHIQSGFSVRCICDQSDP